MAGLKTLFAVGMLAAFAARGQAVSASPEAPAYKLSVDDVIQVRALEAEEISDKAVKIASDGYINLPTVGRLQAAGRTVDEVQAEIVERLKKLIVSPDVTVSLVETHKESMSVIGAVKTP